MLIVRYCFSEIVSHGVAHISTIEKLFHTYSAKNREKNTAISSAVMAALMLMGS